VPIFGGVAKVKIGDDTYLFDRMYAVLYIARPLPVDAVVCTEFLGEWRCGSITIPAGTRDRVGIDEPGTPLPVVDAGLNYSLQQVPSSEIEVVAKRDPNYDPVWDAVSIEKGYLYTFIYDRLDHRQQLFLWCRDENGRQTDDVYVRGPTVFFVYYYKVDNVENGGYGNCAYLRASASPYYSSTQAPIVVRIPAAYITIIRIALFSYGRGILPGTRKDFLTAMVDLTSCCPVRFINLWKVVHMPIPKNDRDVLLDVPQWLLKKMVKVGPSPIVGGDGEGVYYVGRFSDVWAPEDLRNKEFYYLHAKVMLKTDQAAEATCGAKATADPFFASPASRVAFVLFRTMCGSRDTSYSWDNCLDPQFEGTGIGCYGSATIRATTYEWCMFSWSPVMLIFSQVPSSYTDQTNIAAYSKPCPVYSYTPSLSGKAETSGKVLIRAVGCDDSSNRVRYVRYTSEDRNQTSYTIAAIGIGEIAPDETGTRDIAYTWLRYPLSSSVTKSATDYYYYIYTIGLQYQ